MIRERREKENTYKVGNREINSVRFTDDPTLIVNSVEAAAHTISLAKEIAGKFVLVINGDKSKILVPKGVMNID